MGAWIESDNPNGWATGKRFSLDQPAPVIMAAGMAGDSLGHWDVVTDGQLSPAPAASAKPPYRVPSMAEVRTTPKNGLRAVSTFSGCGGSCLGFRMAGYDVLWASEFIPAARDTYLANFPDATVDPRDVREVDPAEILAATGLAVGELDVLEGSPPCSSFSTAGKREAGWGQVKPYSDTKQRTDDLFFEYVRLLRGLMPRAFIAENVAGLVRGVAKGYFKEIHRAMTAAGYRVEARLVDAQWLGVPQTRLRTIFVGVRDDLSVAPAFPDPLPYRYSIREAIPWIDGVDLQPHGPNSFDPPPGDADTPAPTVATGPDGGSYYRHQARVVHDTGGLFSKGDVTDRPCPAILVGGAGAADSKHYQVQTEVEGSFGYDGHAGQPVDQPIGAITAQRPLRVTQQPVEPESRMDGYATGAAWDTLRPGEQSERYFNLLRADPSRPVPAVTQLGGHPNTASVAHPFERRKFTIAELRRLCAFPDDFALTGTYAQQWERLGRAVPPLMMRALAEALRDRVLRP